MTPVRALAEVGWQRAALGEARLRALGDEGDRGEPGARDQRLERRGLDAAGRPGQRRPAGCINGRVSLTDERG